jgi:hypothetical protein
MASIVWPRKIKRLKNQIKPTTIFFKVELRSVRRLSILGALGLVEEAIFMRSSWLFKKKTINFVSPHLHGLRNPQRPTELDIFKPNGTPEQNDTKFRQPLNSQVILSFFPNFFFLREKLDLIKQI